MLSEPAELSRRRRVGLAALILLGVGTLLAAGWLAVTWPTLAFVIGARPTRATFLGAVARTGGSRGGTFLYPQFSFTTPDGRVFTFTASSGSTGQPYSQGETVRALYDPRQPLHAVRDDFFDLWAGSAFTGFLAAFPLALGSLFLVLSRARRD